MMFPISAESLQLRTFDIEIIARSLSNQCRWAGHTKTWFSVAEHSVLVCDFMSGSLAGLLHDASEFIFGDIPGPIKHQFPDLVTAEQVLQQRIYDYYGVESVSGIKEADQKAAEIELDRLVNIENPIVWRPNRARKEFLKRFEAMK